MSTMTIEQWESTYQPETNPFDDNASWDGIMFETYDDELAYVREVVATRGDKYVWTWVDTDEGSVLSLGYHWVNRIGYFVCAKPYEGDYAEVVVEDEQAPCEVCEQPIADCDCD